MDVTDDATEEATLDVTAIGTHESSDDETAVCSDVCPDYSAAQVVGSSGFAR